MPRCKWLENHWVFVRPLAVVTLPCARGPLEAPLDNGVVCAELRVLSLSLGKGRLVYLWSYDRNFGQILRWVPKVSEIITNHWVFLRCDWSPVSKHGKMGGLGWVNRVAGKKWVISSVLKTGLSQSRCGSGWVDLYFHIILFLFFYFYK